MTPGGAAKERLSRCNYSASVAESSPAGNRAA